MAPAASSSSLLPRSDALVLPDSIKVLAITDNDDLLHYTTDGKKTTLVENIGYESGSSVALVGNYVYVVGGGFDNHILTSRVVYYDITPSSISLPLVKHQGPSLNSPKFTPTLIVMASKLFAFSRRFLREMPPPNPSSLSVSSPLGAPESLPICEYLDTSPPLSKWHSLTSFPVLPPPESKGLYAYAISSYAVQPNKDTLFLSFGLSFDSIGFFSIRYNHSLDFWTNVHPSPLPFVGQGHFIDDVCFGFPCGMDTHHRDYVVSYRVFVESDFADTFQFTPLVKYSLLSNSTLTNFSALFSFELISSRILTTIRVIPQGNRSSREVYELELQVLELLPLVEKKQLQGMEEIILHSTDACFTTTYTGYDPFQAIVGAYW